MALLLLDNLYRETIGTRVYQGSIDGVSGEYDHFKKQVYEIATAFSRSPHFEIIDSYSDRWWSNKPWDGQQYSWDPYLYRPSASYTGKRHKGDPIVDTEVRSSGYTYPIWSSYGDSAWSLTHTDIGHYNSWFVVECQTENPILAAMGFSGLPKWQMKFQWYSSTAHPALQDVSDPTGVKYPDYHDNERIMVTRMGAWGGWDLADVTPDFNPASPPLPAGVTPSTQNSHFTMGSGAADMRTQFIITSSGVVNIISTVSSGGKGFVYNGLYAGDVIPRTVVDMPMPRALYGNSWGTSEGFSYNGFLEADGASSGKRFFSFWDYNNELVNRSIYHGSRRSALRWAAANHPYADYLEKDAHPIIIFPDSRPGMMIELSYMKQGYCSAQQTSHNKNWLHIGPTWGTIFPWDGVTDPWAGY